MARQVKASLPLYRKMTIYTSVGHEGRGLQENRMKIAREQDIDRKKGSEHKEEWEEDMRKKELLDRQNTV